RAAVVGRAVRLFPRAGAGPGVRGGAGDLRGVRGAAGGTGRAAGRRGHPTVRRGPDRAGVPGVVPGPVPGGELAGLAGRPAATLGQLGDARGGAAPLRHQVLPRRDAGRAARRRGDLGGGGGLLGDSAAGAAGLGGGQVPAAPADPRDVDRGGRPRQPGQRLARGAGTGEDPAEDDQAGRQVADSAPRGAGIPGGAVNEHPAHGELRPVTEHASVLLANNPSPMTLEGTNSWVVRAPGSADCVVIDPGPEDTEHLQRLADCGPVSLVLLTHHHGDHPDGVAGFRNLTGAPVRPPAPELCAGAEPLADDEVVSAAGVRLRVLATPGHTRDSVCFALEQSAEPVVFTGDTVLGRGTTVIADPDGHLGSYLSSLRRLAELPPGVRALPGH